MIDRRRLLGGLSMYVRIHHNDRPMSLIGGYQGMFVSITMIDRLSLLGGGLSKYICIYHNDGPTSLIGGLFRSLEFRPLWHGPLGSIWRFVLFLIEKGIKTNRTITLVWP